MTRIEELIREYEKNPITITQPPQLIIGIRMKGATPLPSQPKDGEAGVLKQENSPEETISEEIENTSYDLDYENLSLKEIKQIKKEEKKLEKDFEKTRKDLRKRGFDTGLLQNFDNPNEVYEKSDEELQQIRIAGFINHDGFYDLKLPDDIDDARSEPFSTKKIFIILGCAVLCIGLVWYLINNAFTIF